MAEGSPLSLAETGFEGTGTSPSKRHVALTRQESVVSQKAEQEMKQNKHTGDMGGDQ